MDNKLSHILPSGNVESKCYSVGFPVMSTAGRQAEEREFPGGIGQDIKLWDLKWMESSNIGFFGGEGEYNIRLLSIGRISTK